MLVLLNIYDVQPIHFHLNLKKIKSQHLKIAGHPYIQVPEGYFAGRICLVQNIADRFDQGIDEIIIFGQKSCSPLIHEFCK